MKHCGTKRLETDGLVLRPFTIDDAEAMFKNWTGDPEVTKFLTWPNHPSADVSRMLLTDWVSHYDKADYYQWAITLKENGDEPIGSIAVVQQNDQIKMVHIGYCIGKAWWGRGIMTEALSALIAFFFEEVGVNRIEARFDPRNPNSGKVMAKCGMKHEGTYREADYNNQGLCDCEMYAILARDFAPKPN